MAQITLRMNLGLIVAHWDALIIDMKKGKIPHFQESLIIFRWQWCWWHRYFGDFMMVTDFRCWWQNHYVGDFFRYVGDFLYILNRSPTSWMIRRLNRSPTSQTCHQHIWSPTSVTNIDVTLKNHLYFINSICLMILIYDVII